MQEISFHIPNPGTTLIVEEGENGWILTSFKEYADGTPGYFIDRYLVTRPEPVLGRHHVDANSIRQLLHAILEILELYPNEEVITDGEKEEED